MNPKMQGTISRAPFYNAVFIYSFNYSFTCTYKYLLSGKYHDLSDTVYFTEVMTFVESKIMGFVLVRPDSSSY